MNKSWCIPLAADRVRSCGPLSALAGNLLCFFAALFAMSAAEAQPYVAGKGSEPPRWEDHRPSGGEAAVQRFNAGRVRQIVADLPAAAPLERVERAVTDLLSQIDRAAGSDLPAIAEAVENLRRQPAAVEAMARQYRQLPAEGIERRLVVLGLLGEMRRSDAVAPLREVVWSPLPSVPVEAEGLSARDTEERVQVKAVEGLAFLGTAEADAVVREVIEKHPALHVRISAIDAYMWNHGDEPETAAELYRSLPAAMHPFIERPRFHGGMDREDFSRRLRAWRAKWAKGAPRVPGGEK